MWWLREGMSDRRDHGTIPDFAHPNPLSRAGEFRYFTGFRATDAAAADRNNEETRTWDFWTANGR